MYSFPYLEPVCCSMSISNCCFLTCIQISQEASQVVWYSHLFKNFPQLVLIHTVKSFGIVNKAEIDVFLEFSCIFYDPADVDLLICFLCMAQITTEVCMYVCVWGRDPCLHVLHCLHGLSWLMHFKLLDRDGMLHLWSIQFSLVTQSCLTLCNPMDCSSPGFPVHHQLLELTQTHVHWVSDAIQPSHPLSSPSPPAFNLSQHQSLFQWVCSSHEVAKVLELQLWHQSFQWIFRTDFL